MYTRGSTIVFNVKFYDESGAETLGTGPILRVSYVKNRATVTETFDLERVGSTNTYTTSWDSSNAVAGEVFWYAEASANVGVVAGQDSFVLEANRANPS